MFSYTDVQNVLQSSQWDKQAQDKMSALLPRLGQNTLHFLFTKIGGPGSEVLAEELVTIAQRQMHWYEILPKGDTGVVQREFYEIWQNASNPGELMLLNVIRDIRSNSVVNEAVTTELSNAFNYLVCSFLGEVGAVDVQNILSKGALQAAAYCNLSQEVKRYCYLKEIDDVQSREAMMFIRALENNSEQLGTMKVNLASGDQDPLVKNWVQGFLEMGSKQTGRSTYNVAYFMTNHPVAAKLPASHKDQLADILRLYNWLHIMEFVPQEFDNYELEREEFFEQAKQNVINLGLGLLNPNAVGSLGGPDEAVDVTPEQLASMRDIAGKKLKGVNYNGKSIRELMDDYKGPRGLALGQKTNIAVDKERERLIQDRVAQKASIEKKLQELRKRQKG